MNLKFVKSFSLILLFLSSCYSELSEIELGKIEWSPELGLPVIDSKFSVKDLLEATDSTFQYGDENGTLVIYFSEDSLFSESASNYYSLQDRNFNLPPLFLTPDETNEFNDNGQVIILREVAINYPQDGLTEIVIDQGTISLTVEENFPANGNLSLKFRTNQSTAETPNILDFNYSLNYTDGGDEISEIQETDSFENISFDFEGEEDDSKIFIAYELLLQKVANNDLVFGENSIQLNFNFTNMVFGALYGDLGPQEIITENNKIETNFLSQNDVLNEIDYFFEDPKFRIIYKNSMGVPVRFNVASFSSFKDGEENEIPVNEPISLNAASEAGDVTSSTANFDEIFKSLINDLPEAVELQIEGQIDPDDTPNNFVIRGSNIQIGYEVEIPLQLSLSGLRIEDTFSFSGIDPQDLNYALFKFTSENSLPLELDFKAVFLDEDSVELYTLFDGRFLDAGNVGQPRSITELFELRDNPETANNELDFLQNADRIGIIATVATTNGGNQVVNISADAEVKFNLAVQAQYTVKLNEKD